MSESITPPSSREKDLQREFHLTYSQKLIGGIALLTFAISAAVFLFQRGESIGSLSENNSQESSTTLGTGNNERKNIFFYSVKTANYKIGETEKEKDFPALYTDKIYAYYPGTNEHELLAGTEVAFISAVTYLKALDLFLVRTPDGVGAFDPQSGNLSEFYILEAPVYTGVHRGKDGYWESSCWEGINSIVTTADGLYLAVLQGVDSSRQCPENHQAARRTTVFEWQGDTFVQLNQYVDRDNPYLSSSGEWIEGILLDKSLFFGLKGVSYRSSLYQVYTEDLIRGSKIERNILSPIHWDVVYDTTKTSLVANDSSKKEKLCKGLFTKGYYDETGYPYRESAYEYYGCVLVMYDINTDEVVELSLDPYAGYQPLYLDRVRGKVVARKWLYPNSPRIAYDRGNESGSSEELIIPEILGSILLWGEEGERKDFSVFYVFEYVEIDLDEKTEMIIPNLSDYAETKGLLIPEIVNAILLPDETGKIERFNVLYVNGEEVRRILYNGTIKYLGTTPE